MYQHVSDCVCSYFVHPWDCWSIGLHMNTPGSICNNQPIEIWHKFGDLARWSGEYVSLRIRTYHCCIY